MEFSNVQICNMALTHVGVSDQIGDLDTESSKEARVCRLWFGTCREEVLRAFPWPFATRIDDLALTTGGEDGDGLDPNDEWSYEYRYPSNCAKVRRILSGTRQDSQNTKVPYRIARDDTGRVIWTDLEDAQIEYTEQLDTPGEYDADFASALSYLIASKIGSTFGETAAKLADRALRLYVAFVGDAQDHAASEEGEDLPPDAELISGRS